MSLTDTASVEDPTFVENDAAQLDPPQTVLNDDDPVSGPTLLGSTSSNYYPYSYYVPSNDNVPCTCPEDPFCSLPKSFYSSLLGPTADESILVGLQTFFGFAGNCGDTAESFCCGGKCPGSTCDVTENCQKLIPCLKKSIGKSSNSNPNPKARQRGCRSCVNRNVPTYVVNNVVGMDPGVTPSAVSGRKPSFPQTSESLANQTKSRSSRPLISSSKYFSQPEIEQASENLNNPPRISVVSSRSQKINDAKKEARISKQFTEPLSNTTDPSTITVEQPQVTQTKSQRFASHNDPTQSASLNSPVRAVSLKSNMDSIGPDFDYADINRTISRITTRSVPPPQEPSHMHVEPSHISHHHHDYSQAQIIKPSHSHMHHSHQTIPTSPSRWTTATKISKWHNDLVTDTPDDKPTKEHQDTPINNCGCMNYMSPYCTCGFNQLPQKMNGPFPYCNDIHIFNPPGSYINNAGDAICKNCFKQVPFPNNLPRLMPPQPPGNCTCCKCQQIDNNNNKINWCTCDNPQMAQSNQHNNNFCTCNNNCPQPCRICQYGNVISN